MAATSTSPISARFSLDAAGRHKLRLGLTACAAATLLLTVAAYGFPYYTLELTERVHSPYHAYFRPSGSVGIRLGMLGFGLFGVLFLYPIRKRWKWLSTKGKTKHWLDFHVLCGITAPLAVTLHSSFRLGGIAGMAYWIMVAVALSGFIGRYLYSQIPRSINTAEMTLKELDAALANLSAQLALQPFFSADVLAAVLHVPLRTEVQRLSLPGALARMMALDISRLFRVAALRRRFLAGAERWVTVGGFLRSSNAQLEEAIAAVRRHAWLSTRMAFLERAQQIFHLWHVVHRPFSYSFAILVLVHVTVALLFGYV
jgi:hypothetical protein